MSFSVTYDYESARVNINALSGVNYYYMVFCRTGTASGSGTIVYQSDFIPISGGRSYSTPWFSLDEETTYTANVLYYSTDSAESYVGAMGAYEFTTPSAPSTHTIYCTLNYYVGSTLVQTIPHSETTGTSDWYISVTQPSNSTPGFRGWLYNGTLHEAGTTADWYASEGGQTYNLYADIQSGGTCSIYTSGGWQTATPYIYYNGAWRPATPHIYDNGWKPTS